MKGFQNPLPSGVAVQVRLPVPYFKTEPQRKLGLCCIWSLESVAFAVAAGMPVQSVRLTGTIYRKVAFIATFRRFGRLRI
jgi:hypothetical protein